MFNVLQPMVNEAAMLAEQVRGYDCGCFCVLKLFQLIDNVNFCVSILFL
jgi:hypothetical protein